MHEFETAVEKIEKFLSVSADPDTAFSYFYDFLLKSTAKSTIFELIMSFRVVGEIIFGIFSQSNTLSIFLINNPEYIFWLIDNDVMSNRKDRSDYYREIKEVLKSIVDLRKKEYLLRFYRKREYLRIAAREIVSACNFLEILEELSDLACALVEVSIELAYERFKKVPEKEGFCVVGLGKLGNRELNFSSDIDLIFVHRNKEQSEFFNRLSSNIISILSQNKEGGFVYRVDTRLRPGGIASPLSLSLDEYENYYSTFGQPWERLVLLKAKPVAGDMKLGEDFIETIKPFVYRKSIDIEYIGEIRKLMFKIHRNYTSCASSIIEPQKQDIKKGKGGIREIEFIVNYFQLLYGGKNREFTKVSTTEGLRLLKKKGLLKEADFLKDAYIFFRRIEHKLQLLDEKQTQMLPKTREGIQKLSIKLSETLDSFLKKYNFYTEGVHNVFRRIFVLDSGLPIFSTEEDLEGFLSEFDLKDAPSISRAVIEVVRKFSASEVSRFKIQKVFDFVFEYTKDIGLFSNVVHGFLKINPLYVASVSDNSEILKLMVKLLAVSYGDKFMKNPSLMDSLLAPSKLVFTDLDLKEKERIELEIVTKMISGNYDHDDLKVTTEFAREFIIDVARRYDREGQLCIVGYGKLATGELFVGSDLDIVFVSKKNDYRLETVVRKIIRDLKRVYEVDLRLRPYGDKGSLVVNVDYLKRYFENEASSWEKQAAQRSCIVYSGFDDAGVERIFRDFISQNPPTKREIYSMLKKIVENKGAGVDLKSSLGCITNIEFLSQAICFENHCIELSESTLDLIRKIRSLDLADKMLLSEAYLFFFKLLNVLRLAGLSSKLNSKSVEIVEFLLSEGGIKDTVGRFRQNVIQISRRYFGDYFGD